MSSPVLGRPRTTLTATGTRVDLHDQARTALNAAACVLFSLTIFVSAALLFMMQPMFAKMALPLLGGTPAVWNTCMVFFQALLLVGYGYAHATPAALGVRRQAVLHLALLLSALIVLPVTIPEGWSPTAQSPFMGLLALLLVALGLPFLVVSTTAPLVQKWFAGTDHPLARDPYFLYAASNVGSLASLLAYPTLIEPNLRLADQSRLWALGYVLLIGLLVGCAAVVWRSRASTVADAAATVAPAAVTTDEPIPVERLAVLRRARWVLLAFVPSSLMLGVTTYLSTDVAPMPLLWVVPLAVYLLTFVLAFGRRARVSHQRLNRPLPVLVLPLAMTMSFGAVGPLWILAILHLLTFFVISMVCHGDLASGRPLADRLTEFFLWVAVGGVLGGIFNALLAPMVFSRLIEYPLVLVAACLLRRPHTPGRPTTAARWELAVPLVVGATILGTRLARQNGPHRRLAGTAARRGCTGVPVLRAPIPATGVCPRAWRSDTDDDPPARGYRVSNPAPGAHLLRDLAGPARSGRQVRRAPERNHRARPTKPRAGARARAALLLPSPRADRSGVRRDTGIQGRRARSGHRARDRLAGRVTAGRGRSSRSTRSTRRSCGSRATLDTSGSSRRAHPRSGWSLEMRGTPSPPLRTGTTA